MLSLGLLSFSLPCFAEDVEVTAVEFAESLAVSEDGEMSDDMIDELLSMDFDDDDEDDEMGDAVVFGDDDFDDEIS